MPRAKSNRVQEGEDAASKAAAAVSAAASKSSPPEPPQALLQAQAAMAELDGGVQATAEGFEITVIFSHFVALWLTQHTIYRSKTPGWSYPVLGATFTILSKYLFARLVESAGGLSAISKALTQIFYRGDRVSRAALEGAGYLAIFLVSLVVLLGLVANTHAPATVVYWFLPVPFSLGVWRSPAFVCR